MRSARICNFSGILALAFWWTSIGYTRSATEAMGGPFTTGAVIFGGGGVLLLIVELLRVGAKKLCAGFTPKMLAVCGLSYVCYTVLYVCSCGLAPNREVAVQIGLINYLWPLFTIILSLFFFSFKARWCFLLPGSALAIAGMVVAVLPGASLSSIAANLAQNWLPFLLMLVCALAWGLYSNACKRFSQPGAGNAVPFFQIASGLAFLAAKMFFPEDSHWEAAASGQVIYLAVVVVALAYCLWEMAMRGGDLVLLSAVSYLSPLASTVFACWLLGEPLHQGLLIGCILIIAGAVLSRLGVKENGSAE